MKITMLKYHYVGSPYDFWHIRYKIDDLVFHVVYKSAWEVEESALKIPEYVEKMLGIKIGCTPVEEPERLFDEKGKWTGNTKESS